MWKVSLVTLALTVGLGCMQGASSPYGPTSTGQPTVMSEATTVPNPTPVTSPTIDIQATIAAGVQATIEAIPMTSLVPIATATSTVTPPPTLVPTETITPTSTPKPIPPPLEIVPLEMTKNSIGTPQFNLKLTNVSDKVIDGYEVNICPKNRFGEFVRSGADRCFKGIGNDVLHTLSETPPPEYRLLGAEFPGVYWKYESDLWSQADYASWTLYLFDTASQADVELLRVHFQDGTIWEKEPSSAGKLSS